MLKRDPITGAYLNKHGLRNVDHRVELAFVPATAEEKAALGEKPDGYIAGWASTPGLDSYDHIVAPGAFDAAIKARGLKGPRSIHLLLDHNWQQLAGSIEVLETRGGRLWIEAQLGLDITYVRDRYIAAKMIGGVSYSVGFMLQDYEFKEDPITKKEYLLIKRGDLYEVSVVTFPANEECTMEFIKSRLAPTSIASVAEFEKHLRDSGLVKSRDDARRITQVVKSVAALFHNPDGSAPVAAAPDPSPEPVPENLPMPGGQQLSKVSAALADLRKAIAGS